ncbi:7297_t:CDS:2, partial [Cetraspora pellucida]
MFLSQTKRMFPSRTKKIFPSQMFPDQTFLDASENANRDDEVNNDDDIGGDYSFDDDNNDLINHIVNVLIV